MQFSVIAVIGEVFFFTTLSGYSTAIRNRANINLNWICVIFVWFLRAVRVVTVWDLENILSRLYSSKCNISISLSNDTLRLNKRKERLDRFLCTYRTFNTYITYYMDIMVSVFANGPGHLGSIPGRVIPKTQKMVFDVTLLNTQHYKVRIKGKVEQSRERSSTLPYTSV